VIAARAVSKKLCETTQTDLNGHKRKKLQLHFPFVSVFCPFVWFHQVCDCLCSERLCPHRTPLGLTRSNFKSRLHIGCPVVVAAEPDVGEVAPHFLFFVACELT
jgi:hypothetical protein